MEKHTLLVLGTGHITEATGKMLDTLPLAEWPVAGGAYGEVGWFFYAPNENYGSIPEDLWGICQFAQAQGCNYVLLDRDAEHVAELPFWEW